MTSQADNTPTAPAGGSPPVFDERLRYQLRMIAVAISHTPGHRPLYLLAGAIVLVIIATAAAQVALNAWMQPFYDAIDKKVLGAFFHQLVVFFVIAGILLVLNVSQTGLNQAIRLKLREFATQDLIANWMTQKRAARISRAGQIGINPDQRIHEDAHHLAELSTDLGIGLLQASLLLASFIGVLWTLSRGLVLHFGGQAFVIPGYMVWAALIYAATGSWFSWRVGRRLVRLQQTRYAREADLRVALVQSVEQADGIALGGGETDARRQLNLELRKVLAMMWQIVLATIRLTWVTAGYGWVALVFPIIVAAPGYFGGALSFGELMMVVGAFNQVQQSLRWFVDNTGAIADWRATLLRVMNFRQALLNLDRFEAGAERFERVEHPEGRLALDDLNILRLRGQAELSEHHIDIGPGERVLITGEPGSGKSTLFLAIAGLWDWGTGRISLPPAQTMMFLSQRPFIPPGSLRTVLTYADGQQPFSDAQLTAALQQAGLEQLCQSLDRVERWDKELTFEEQQRLAFARVLLYRPRWVISDEALDTIDDGDQTGILSIFEQALPETAVVSISGRASGNGFYSRVIQLIAHPAGNEPQPAGPRAAVPKPAGSAA